MLVVRKQGGRNLNNDRYVYVNVDDSPKRRGRPTVAAAEGPARAIAVGDYYFAKATRLIAELGNPDVTSTIATAMEAICRSQIDDLEFRGGYPGDFWVFARSLR